MSTLGYNPFAGTGKGALNTLWFPAHSRVSSGEPPCTAPPAEIYALVVRAAKNEWFQQPAHCRFRQARAPQPCTPTRADNYRVDRGAQGRGAGPNGGQDFSLPGKQAAEACCKRGCPGECLLCQKFSRQATLARRGLCP